MFDGPVELWIPSGTQSGETFRVEGEGLPHVQQPGQDDLYVQAQVVTPDELPAAQRRAL